jgi:hypothetical protein
MLNELGATTQGPSVFLARLLREVYAGDVAQYRTWMPGAQVMTLTSGSKKDPVNPERTYFASPNDCYVIYWYGSRITRSAAFHLVLNAKTGLWQLSEIYYSDKQDMASSSVRWVDWAITVYTDSLPKSTDYVFIPPRNSRGIANPRTSGGG